MIVNSFNTELLDFLVVRIPDKKLIEYVVMMLPDRYFYYPEIETDRFSSYREEVNELIKSARKTINDYSGMNATYLQKEYHSELEQLVTRKRKLLVFGILLQEEDKRREILYELIQDNHLTKYLNRMKEVFREWKILITNKKRWHSKVGCLKFWFSKKEKEYNEYFIERLFLDSSCKFFTIKTSSLSKATDF